jgi:hypothetical protein
MIACRLIPLPRTFDKRLLTIWVDIKDKVSGMGILSVKERLLDDPYIVTIDSTLL